MNEAAVLVKGAALQEDTPAGAAAKEEALSVTEGRPEQSACDDQGQHSAEPDQGQDEKEAASKKKVKKVDETLLQAFRYFDRTGA